jgi:hypothetical protein
MSSSKKACIYSAQGEMRCCDNNDKSCYHETFWMEQVKQNQKSQPSEEKKSIVEAFTKNAPLFEEKKSDSSTFEPVGVSSTFIDQFYMFGK